MVVENKVVGTCGGERGGRYFVVENNVVGILRSREQGGRYFVVENEVRGKYFVVENEVGGTSW